VTKYAKPYPDFDEATVRYGNTKDPAKRSDLLASKRIDHEEGRGAYWSYMHDRAALDPFTGAIVCIGIIAQNGEPEIIAEATEAATIRQFWWVFALSTNATTKFVFWSGSGDVSKNFDIDFIVTRSRILRIPLPHRVRNGRYYDGRIIDLSSEFLLLQRDRFLKLTVAADMLGLYQDHKDIFPKTEQDAVQGADFWKFWDGVALASEIPNHPGIAFTRTEQRALAVQYLGNDLLTTKYLAAHILS
jgi:hypothetical protein